MMKKVVILFMVLAFTACSTGSRNTTGSNTVVPGKIKPNQQVETYTFQIIPAAENTYGYEITEHGKIIVQQKTIPSLPGNKGFRTQDYAEKCALFVISKLNRNIIPPTVTPEEIDSIGIKTTLQTNSENSNHRNHKL